MKPGFAPAARLASLLALRFCFKPETRMGFPAFHVPLLRPLRRASFAPFRLLSFHPKVAFQLARVAMTLVLFNFSKSSKRSSRSHHLIELLPPPPKHRNTLYTRKTQNPCTSKHLIELPNQTATPMPTSFPQGLHLFHGESVDPVSGDTPIC